MSLSYQSTYQTRMEPMKGSLNDFENVFMDADVVDVDAMAE